jgi:hypothetical protein
LSSITKRFKYQDYLDDLLLWWKIWIFNDDTALSGLMSPTFPLHLERKSWEAVAFYFRLMV